LSQVIGRFLCNRKARQQDATTLTGPGRLLAYKQYWLLWRQ
jgi:hypothetical protein